MWCVKRSLLIGSVLALMLTACGKSTPTPDAQASAAALAQQWITGTATNATATPLPSHTPDVQGSAVALAQQWITGTATNATATSSPSQTPDVQGSAVALAQQWITGTATNVTATPLPSHTPDIRATVDRGVLDTLTAIAAQWTPTPSATLTPTPNLDATAQAMVAAALTGTATQWTLTPTPNLDATVAIQVALALTGTAANQPPSPLAPTVNVSNDEAADDDAFLGPEDAPVVIVEFGDYQCGYCQRFYEDTLPRILEKYPSQVKYVYRDFPIFGDDSVRAAEAAECAEEQGKFWEMHDAIFESRTEANPLPLSQATLEELAAPLGLDMDAFTQCLESGRYIGEVTSDSQAALDYGVQGTPTFLINGSLVQGAQSFEFFDRIIQAALNAPSD